MSDQNNIELTKVQKFGDIPVVEKSERGFGILYAGTHDQTAQVSLSSQGRNASLLPAKNVNTEDSSSE
jgi:hypothetical protein